MNSAYILVWVDSNTQQKLTVATPWTFEWLLADIKVVASMYF